MASDHAQVEENLILLAVDDRSDNLFVLQQLIGEHLPGCEVRTAANAQEGLALAFDLLPDGMFIDVQMPGMNGIEMCRRLKNDERTAHIPIILVTAHRSTPQLKAEGLNAGADDFISKPIDNVELVARIKVMLRIKHAEDALRKMNLHLEGLVRDRTRALEESERRQRIENRVLSVLSTSADESVFADMLDTLLDVFQCRFGFFGYIREEDGALVCPSMSRGIWDQCNIPDKSIVFPRESWAGLWGRVLLERKSFIKNGPHRVPEGHLLLSNSFGAPILYRGELIGAIHLANKDESFAEEDRELLDYLSAVIAPVLHAWLQRGQQEEERQRMAEEAHRTQRLRAVGELSAGVSHNLNNILTGILMPAQLLQRVTDDPDILEEAAEIVTYAQRASDLVHRLHLSVRGIEEDALQAVFIDPVVEEAVMTARPRWKDEAEARGISIEVTTELGDVPAIRGTKSRLHDILTNLLFNAVDAMPQGGTVSIHTQTVGDRVQLTFRDAGSGMDEATRSRVFEPFFTTKGNLGTGLGLSTVYNTVTQWGGEVEVESAPGEGTTFIMQLLLWEDTPSGKPEEKESISPRRGRLLIVDDEEGICDVLSRLLRKVHEVETERNGREALERFTAGRYDVVFVDLGMPGMSGDRVVREMHQIDPSVVTVLITGWELDEGDPRRKSFDFQIQKPFDGLNEIETVVARAIELHDTRVKEDADGVDRI